VELESGELRIIDWKAIEALRDGAILGAEHVWLHAALRPPGAEIAYSAGD
jgi:hypothetical protein